MGNWIYVRDQLAQAHHVLADEVLQPQHHALPHGDRGAAPRGERFPRRRDRRLKLGACRLRDSRHNVLGGLRALKMCQAPSKICCAPRIARNLRRESVRWLTALQDG